MGQLLEREAELAHLHGALADATVGDGRVVFVGGEARIGKTALVEHFTGDVDGGVLAVFGRCDALGTPRALGPFAQASSGDTASLRLAMATFERLGAAPAAERVAAELRTRGVRVARESDRTGAFDPTTAATTVAS